jgi:hypothetical protein
MLCIPTGVSSFECSEDEIFSVGVNMQVVPEFGQGFKRFGCCCDAGLDVIVIWRLENVKDPRF